MLVDGRPDQLTRLLSNLHRQTEAYALFGILDPKGRLIAGSRPSAMTRDFGGRTWLAACLEQQRLTMGPYHGEHIDGVPVLYIAQPINTGQQEIAAMAFTALDLNRMNRTLFKQLAELPPGSRLTLMDEDQVVLRYAVDTARWSVAQPFDPALRQKIGSQPAVGPRVSGFLPDRRRQDRLPDRRRARPERQDHQHLPQPYPGEDAHAEQRRIDPLRRPKRLGGVRLQETFRPPPRCASLSDKHRQYLPQRAYIRIRRSPISPSRTRLYH